MFRMILLALAGYFGYKLFKGNKPASQENPVKGQNDHSPLDLTEQDVDDADFEDLPGDK